MGEDMPAFVGRQIQLSEKFNNKTLDELGACTEDN
jgi:hypothetical protein